MFKLLKNKKKSSILNYTSNYESIILKIKTELNKIKKITNVYQEKFLNGYSTGLGDFIRGSIFLLQYCRLYNIECDISIKNHKIFKFLNIYDNTMNEPELNIFSNRQINCLRFDIEPEIKNINYTYFETIQLFNSYLYSIKDTYTHNNLNINTIYFPLYDTIIPEHKECIKRLIEPNDAIKTIAYNALTEMKLSIMKYKVVHIRCGDKELIDKIINITKHDKILNILEKYNNTNILVISDSNALKEKIKIKYPLIRVFKNNIKHIGEGVINNDNTYISLLVDLLMISLSNEVLGLSVLEHGSGFSQWISIIHDIPYKCLYID